MKQSLARFTTEANAAQGAECPAGQPEYFFCRPGPNVSRLRRPGAATAQPRLCLMLFQLQIT